MSLNVSKNMIKENLKLLLKLLIIGITVFSINKFFVQLCFVRGDSMNPNLKDGQVILIKKFKLDLQYGDIVVINKNKKIIIKRLVGLPNDKIRIDKYLYINDQKMDNYYIENKGDVTEEVYLTEDEYFVLGDNLNNSIDSRTKEIGKIYKSEIIGKMIFNKNKK